jgi:SlyX protein
MLTEEQLIDLQSRIAFQEDSLIALNDVIARQQQEIDVLERELRLHRDKLVEILDWQATRGAAEPTDEKPPHY